MNKSALSELQTAKAAEISMITRKPGHKCFRDCLLHGRLRRRAQIGRDLNANEFVLLQHDGIGCPAGELQRGQLAGQAVLKMARTMMPKAAMAIKPGSARNGIVNARRRADILACPPSP